MLILILPSVSREKICVTLWDEIKTENEGKAMWEMSEMHRFYCREKCTNLEVLLAYEDPLKVFQYVLHIEGFWLLKDFNFRVFIKLHFPSDAGEALVLSSQPESKWNGCWRFQGVRKRSRGRGIMPCAQRSCAALPGWVCVRAGTPRMLSRCEGRCLGGKASTADRTQLLELIC